jgi:8-oxo-dGTP pyrophosphatase MutT (NUDIX family)
VTVRVLIVQDDKILLVKETLDGRWAFPGGGVDYGETIESAVAREIEEELGVPAMEISSDFQIAYYDIGAIISAVPRMNLFFKVSVPKTSLKKTEEVSEWKWFTKDEFLAQELHASYDKMKLVDVIFGE